MARPAKSVKTQSRHNTKSEEKQRQEVEEKSVGKLITSDLRRIYQTIKKRFSER